MLELISAGYDPGNGWNKLSIDDKASKIPNYSTIELPKGALTSTGVYSKARAFPMLVKGKIRHFGQDTLSLAGSQEMDLDKYKSEYIKTMFQATLNHWINQHNIDPKWLGDKRLNIVCGMPPEDWQTPSIRNLAVKAFKAAFNDRKPQYLKTPDNDTVVYFTSFHSVQPEAMSWKDCNRGKAGYTLIADLGFGTSDLCVLHAEVYGDIIKTEVIDAKSIDNGLEKTHNETNKSSPWLSELKTIRTKKAPETYTQTTKMKIRSVARRIELARLVVFGGGVKLLDKSTISDFRRYADDFVIGDEFTNVRNFMRLAK